MPTLLRDLRQDLRYGLRMFLAHPGFTLVALLTIAVGIGATTTIFTVVNAVLLKPLPFAQPERLAMLWVDDQHRGLHEERASSLLVSDWRESSRVFADMAIFTGNACILPGGDAPERAQGAFVSANLFPLLGVAPVLGRTFTAEEERGATRVAVLSHALWQRRFGGAADAVGNVFQIDGDMNATKQGPRTVLVIGVMPPGFAFPSKDTQFWEPATVYWRWQRESVERFIESARRWGVVGRMNPGASIDGARAEMSDVGRRLAQSHPVTDPTFPGFAVNVVPLLDQIVGKPLQLGLWVLLGAVACLLLIACANVANLLLARGATRAREFAIRSAIGAGRARLIRQLLVESLVLSAVGGASGLWLASAGTRMLTAANLAGIPRLEELTIDTRVLGVSAGLSILAGLLFSLAPAWWISRDRAGDAMKEGVSGATGGRRLRHMRGLLVLGECALAVVLLAGSGLLFHSFLRLQRVDPGFDPEHVLLVRVGLTPGLRPQALPGVDPGAARFALLEETFHQIGERIDSIPGVRSMGAITSFLNPGTANETITFAGQAPGVSPDAGELAAADVDPEFFRTMSVPLLRGRYFTRADTFEKIRLFYPKAGHGFTAIPPVRGSAEPVIVNQAFVHKYFPAADPIGQRFYIGQLAGKHYWYEVVGVVGDMHRQGLERAAVPEYFGQLIGGNTDLLVRTTGEPAAVAGAVKAAIRSVDSHLMVLSMTPLEERLSALTAPRRFQTWLFVLFASMALGLAAIGIYGVVQYAVAQRTREMGVRIALGANPSDVVRLIVGESVRLPLAGMVIGLTVALSVTRVMRHLLFETAPTDPATYAIVGSLLAIVALLASWLPARRAARVDPVVALRCE